MVFVKSSGDALDVKKQRPNALRVEKAPTPDFQVTVRQRGAKPAAALSAKPPKRDNIFSQSRDTREDRGARQMKTAQNSQTFPHAH
ncbi:MAG: hypothetical protein WDM80_17300 [Limisphaerales bacterium]